MSVIALISTRLLVREAPKSTDRQLLARAPDTAWVIPSAGLAVPVKAWNVPGHMLWRHRLSGASTGVPPEYREGKSSFGKISLVRDLMAEGFKMW